MNEKNKINILLVSLNDRFCKSVAEELADNLEMFVADCHDLIVYDLINPKEVLEKCGLEYLKKREQNVIKHSAEFYNTVLSINFDLLKEFSFLFKQSIIIYLRVPEEKATKVPNKIDYFNRDTLLCELADKVIDLDECLVKRSVEKTMLKLGEFYEDS